MSKAIKYARGDRLLSVKKLTLKFHDTLILDHISFDVKKGEIVTLIGPNGAGKTSLLKTILGFYEVYKGKITLSEGVKIGYVPQKISVSPAIPITVKRFLKLWHASSKEEIQKALQKVGAFHTLKKSLQSLSGGEFQRVLIARALLSNPTLLILDEPVQGVDVIGQRDIYNLLGKLRDELQLSILLVSHDLNFVMAKTDHVICLNHHICCAGHPEEVSNNPEYLALFKEESEYLRPYHHHHDHHHDCPSSHEKREKK